MEKYEFDPNVREKLESAVNPFAIYQFIGKRICPILLSKGFCELFGYSREEAYDLMANNMYRDTHPDDLSRVADMGFHFAEADCGYNVVYRTRRPGEESYTVVRGQAKHFYTKEGTRLSMVWYMDEGRYLEESAGDPDALSRSYNTMLREGSLIQRNYHDTLTGLPNMAHFFTLAESSRAELERRGEQAALLFFDMCGMKLFNRQYGYAEGDQLLRGFAGLLTEKFGGGSCGRFGQDRFAAVAARSMLENTLAELFKQARGLNGGKTLPIRVGVYVDRGDGLTVSAACDRAKYACDSVRSGYTSNFRFYDDSMLEREERRQYIIHNLDRALSEKWVRVYLQPIIRTANDKVSDAEVLARWFDPEKGMLSPAEFIPTLEDARLIYKLDLYMVEQAARQLREIIDRGLSPVPVSVNLSRSDFNACDMVEEICRRVDEAGLSHELLKIEITESTVGKDPEFMRAQVERFHEKGFQVWMDDFGSEYSSLDFLQNIRFDLIKFDLRFMQQFGAGERTRVILTELIRMAISLGIDTVTEGVENEEQLEFLREVGCTKLQGYYFGRPEPMPEILKRYEKDMLRDFEDPRETDYYAAIGRINLYDMAVFSHDEQSSFQNYFNTLPMAVIESDGEGFTLVRCNSTYREFMLRMIGVCFIGTRFDYAYAADKPGSGFLRVMRQCGEDGQQALLDEEMADGAIAHAFMKRISVNPVTGTKAIAVAVLAVIEPKAELPGISNLQLARALSNDYLYIFYVDLDTENYTLYNFDNSGSGLTVEKHGDAFFAACRRDAAHLLDPEDVPYFQAAFTREKLVHDLDARGAFTLTYRMLIDGRPNYVSLKAMRMSPGSSRLIIGVSSIDAQMREKEALERVREERITYARISALSGDYVGIYSVDPGSGHFTRLSLSERISRPRLLPEGDDFFRMARQAAEELIWPEDRALFLLRFTPEKVMQEIEQNGLFEMQLRYQLDGKPVHVCIRAALVEERDGPQLIIGVSDIESRVRREQEYEQELARARSRANIDALTGVKNRSAFEEALRQETGAQPFAVILFDVKGLRAVNAERGYQFGDELLKNACARICAAFKRSPVYRIDGDEFSVIARGHDFENADSLLAGLQAQNEQEGRFGGCAIDIGMAKSREGEKAEAVYARASKQLSRSKA